MNQKTALKRQICTACFLLALIACAAAVIAIAATLQNGSFSVLTLIAVILLAASLILPFLFIYMAKSILFRPLEECADRLHALAEGDLDSPVSAHRGTGEIGYIMESTATIVRNLHRIITDESRILTHMSTGDFTVASDCKELYVNGYEPILKAMRSICFRLNSSLHQIQESAVQVDAGADQVSTGAQALSQGATEQASSVQELAATINDISSQVTESAKNAESASSLAHSVGDDMMDSNLHMSEMTNAMAEIKETSNQIHKIIKTIEDIAFQTNILALNAAVEAARAGSAGKGFAVVAEEVRNLAGKSQDAAQDTTVMIQNAIAAVEKGIRIADETAESMNKVVANAQLVVDQISSISDTTRAQADAITQVTTGIDQISSVVQTNSATAEESAAASEELSGQAALLKDILSGFKFRQDGECGEVSSEPAPAPAKEPSFMQTSSYTPAPAPEPAPSFVGNNDKY